MSMPLKTTLRNIFYSRAINKTAVKLYSFFKPPPYKMNNMEFYYPVWYMISSFHGVRGRQLGENNVKPDRYKVNIDTEHTLCHFKGRRNGLHYNMSALRDTTEVWNECVQFTILLRNDYIKISRN